MIISITLGYLLYLVILRKVWQRGLKIPINVMIAVEETVLTVGYTCWHGVILAVMATEKPLVHYTGSQFCQASRDASYDTGVQVLFGFCLFKMTPICFLAH